MGRVKVVSFDVDGTLVDYTFVNSVWFEEIPKLYAKERSVSFEKARSYVKREYDKVGDERLEWYDIKYWFKVFNLKGNWRDVIEKCRSRVRVYPEVHEVLKSLRNFKLIIISNSPREFLDVELDEAGIRDYFHKTFSSISDFGKIKKVGEIYLKVCKVLGILPQEMVHVGDNFRFDFEVPREVDVNAFYLDRNGRYEGKFIVHDLRELREILFSGNLDRA